MVKLSKYKTKSGTDQGVGCELQVPRREGGNFVEARLRLCFFSASKMPFQ